MLFVDRFRFSYPSYQKLAYFSIPIIRKKLTCFLPRLVIVLSMAILAGCNQANIQTTTETESIQQEHHGASTTEMESLLEAEFTLQREGASKAFPLFYKIAIQTKNPSLIEQLTHIGVASQNTLYIEKSADLWLQSAPNNEQAYALKLQILVKNKQPSEITKLLTQAINHNVSLNFLPTYLDHHVRENEEVDTISQALSGLGLKQHNNPYIQLSDARLLFISGQYEEAEQVSSQLLKSQLIENSEALFLILAYSQQQLGKESEAIDTLKKASKSFPKSLRIYTPLLELLVTSKQLKEAQTIYHSVDASSSTKIQLGINFSRTLLESHQPNEALNILNNLPEQQFGLSNQVNYLKASALSQQGKTKDAIEKMKEVGGILQTGATMQIARWLYDLHDEKDINQTVLSRTQRENIPEQIIAICQLHEERGNTDLSYELLKQTLEQYPDSSEIRYRKALLADTLGHWSEAENDLRLLLKQDPSSPQYLNALGYTLLTRTSKINEAMRYIEQAYEKDENDPAIIDSLGWGFFLKGELEQASYYLKKAWSILQDAEIAAHYGESLWNQKHYKQAIEIWQSALESSPDTPLLIDTIKRLSPSLLTPSKDKK